MSDTLVTPQLSEQLSAFGLNELEAAIYLHLINKQPRTILEIARDLNLPRTSVYDNAVKLAEKGLVEKIVTFKSQKLRAYPPRILQSVVEQEKKRVENLQSQLTHLESQLAQAAHTSNATEVRYYHGVKGFQQMLWNTVSAKEVIGYSQFGRIEIVGESFIVKFHEESIRRGLKDRAITNPNPEMLKYITADSTSAQRKLFQETRVLPASQLYVSGDTSIYNDTFAVTYWKQGEVVGVEIDNAELAKTQKSIFELLWNIAKPVEPFLKETTPEKL